MCDCFLEIVCYCLSFNADFAQFLKMYLMHFDKQKWWNTSQFNRQTLFHVSYVACCKDFVDFQIDLFIETDSFPLRSIDCGNSWVRQQQEVDLDYRDMYWSNSDNSGVFDSSDDDNVELVKGHAFSSSFCYSKMQSNLTFSRFCACCQQVFVMYFVRKLHLISNDVFSL